METYFNGNTFKRALFNGNEVRRIYQNGVLVWQKELVLFENGAYGACGGMVNGYSLDGGAGTAAIENGALRVYGSQSIAFFFAQKAPCAGYSSLNFTLRGVDHQGEHIYVGWRPDQMGFLHLPPAQSYDLHNLVPGRDVYTVPLAGADSAFVGVHILATGKWVSAEFGRIWLA